MTAAQPYANKCCAALSQWVQSSGRLHTQTQCQPLSDVHTPCLERFNTLRRDATHWSSGLYSLLLSPFPPLFSSCTHSTTPPAGPRGPHLHELRAPLEDLLPLKLSIPLRVARVRHARVGIGVEERRRPRVVAALRLHPTPQRRRRQMSCGGGRAGGLAGLPSGTRCASSCGGAAAPVRSIAAPCLRARLPHAGRQWVPATA